ncbi:permease [Desulfolithobacter dissulfuricans]|uniref:permease n=1 Tax=Desulfolithobacter dissulfuricans TaxID=2795293 RepID=UPI002277F580|nr:permease [Desulfolithobacter dissulfuricans]
MQADERRGVDRDNQKPTLVRSLKKSALTFGSMAPMFLGIMGLVGLIQVLVSPRDLAALFRGNPLLDTLTGTVAGAVASGNPVVSYLLGGELQQQGVALYAVTAFILSWVTLGFVHLPVEAAMLGRRFTVYRNVLAFVFTMLIAVATTLTMRFVS